MSSESSLREMFSDNIAEYFNKNIDVTQDITGRKVATNILKATKNSKIKNKSGQLIPLYHATNKSFDTFEVGDIGFHFGSKAQAISRANDKNIENPTFVKAYLDIENPLYIDEDFFGWNSSQIAQKLEKEGIITNEESTSFVKKDSKKGNTELQNLLKEKGYDGIVYKNDKEALNGNSYIVFDDSQILRTDNESNGNNENNEEKNTAQKYGYGKEFSLNKEGNVVLKQNNINYDDRRLRTGSFKIVAPNGDVYNAKGYIYGKFGVVPNEEVNSYPIYHLPSGMVVNASDNLTEAQQLTIALDENTGNAEIAYDTKNKGKPVAGKGLEDVYNAMKDVIKSGAYLDVDVTEKAKSDIRYSLTSEKNNTVSKEDIKNVQSIGRKSVNEFSSSDIKKTEKFARQYYNEMGTKSPFFRAWFGDWRANDNTQVRVANEKGNARGIIKNKDTGWDIQISGKVFNETKAHNQNYNVTARPYLDYINSIAENSVLLDTYTIASEKAKSENSALMHSLYAIADMGNGKELIKLYVEELNDVNSDGTIKRAYQLQNITSQQLNDRVQEKISLAPSASTADTYSVSQLFEIVKRFDKNFQPKVSSKVVNGDGSPKVVYHGTSENFNVFDITKSRSYDETLNYDMPGFYFSESTEESGSYVENLKAYYIDIKNPYTGDTYALQKEKGSFRKAYDYLVSQGYDGIIVDEMGEGYYEYIVFSPENIKSATDNIGTFDKGNPDIRYKISESEAEKIFTATKEENENFAKQVEAWMQGEMKSDEQFQMGQTPTVLKALGAKDLPVVMSQDVMAKITGVKHNISVEDVKKLPNAMADPIMVFSSATVPNAYVILTELTDNNGKDIVTAMHLNRKLDRLSINRISSVYGKENIDNFVVKQINAGNLKYIDKNKSQQWSTSRGLRLPKLVQSITDNNSILQKENIVNSYFEKNSKNYSKGSAERNGRRENLLSGNGRRTNYESAGKQAERFQAYKQELGGKAKAERKEYAKELLERGFTEEKIKGNNKINVVKKEYYNEDMLSIVEKGRAKGKEVQFFIGSGQRSFDYGKDFKIDGMIEGKKRIYIRYDGEYTPQALLQHEFVHGEWDTPEMREARDLILNDLTEKEKEELLSNGRYKDYLDLYEGNAESVFEEFVADVFAGMNDFTQDFADVVTSYYYNGEAVKGYDVSQYSKVVDKGKAKYSFAGDRAETADRSLLETAKKMWKNKNSEEDILKQTGWFKGKDGKWRFEIDDSKGTFNFEGLKETQKLSEVWENEELYRAYPFLKDISVSFVDFGSNNHKSGEYNGNTNSIRLSDQMTQQKFKETLAHEVQHAIQAYEGFDDGGNPFEMKDYLREKAQQYLASVNDKKFNDIIQKGTIKDLYDYINNFIKSEFKADTVEEASQKAYLRLHGEKEARATEKRLNLSEEERKEKYPDYTKGAMVRNVFKRENINDGISGVAENRSESEFIGSLYSDFGRRNGKMERMGREFSSTGISETVFHDGRNGRISYSLTFDPNETEKSDNALTKWNSTMGQYIEKYGAMEKGEIPARDINVPKQTNGKKVVSKFARTMLEAGITPDEAISEFEKSILDGTMTHEVIHDKKAHEEVIAEIRERGFEDALKNWDIIANRKRKMGKEAFVMGMELYNQCVTNKDFTNAMKIAADLSAEATRAGQTLQATRMLKRMSPDGQLYYLEKSVARMNEEFKNKLGKKFKNIELDNELMEKFFTEKDEAKRNEYYDQICQSIADQIPSTFADRWNAWRYLAMLGNPRTHIRNIVENLVFYAPIKTKNLLKLGMENGLYKAGKITQEDKTVSLFKTKKAKEFAKADFKKVKKTLQGENAKYAVTSDIDGKRKIFATKIEAPLEFLRVKNFEFLELEDLLFLRAHYQNALAGVITARNIDVDNITPEQLEKVREYAFQEAWRATYRDSNVLASSLNRLQRNLENSDKITAKVGGALLEGAMPFKKTPLNIAKQGVVYSPLGIIQGLYKTAKKAKNGDYCSSSEIIDDLARGLSGTALVILGYFLRKWKIINSAKDETKKEKEFAKAVGEQDYSINFGDTASYTIDWAAPAVLSLLIGANLCDLSEEDGMQFKDVANALSSVAEPLTELTVFSGINSIIQTAGYSTKDKVSAIFYDVLESYVTQAFPTLGGQVNRMIDKNKRNYYYYDENDKMPKFVRSIAGQASSKILFASRLYEKSVDIWGREETYGNAWERIFENTISPGYLSFYNYTDVDREIKDIYEKTGEGDVLPTVQGKTYTEEKIKYYMNAKDYTEVKKLRGQRSYELLQELFKDKFVFDRQEKKYSKMTDEEKVKAIKKCYTQAGKETKEKMLEKIKKTNPKQVEKAEKAKAQ